MDFIKPEFSTENIACILSFSKKYCLNWIILHHFLSNQYLVTFK